MRTQTVGVIIQMVIGDYHQINMVSTYCNMKEVTIMAEHHKADVYRVVMNNISKTLYDRLYWSIHANWMLNRVRVSVSCDPENHTHLYL